MKSRFLTMVIVGLVSSISFFSLASEESYSWKCTGGNVAIGVGYSSLECVSSAPQYRHAILTMKSVGLQASVSFVNMTIRCNRPGLIFGEFKGKRFSGAVGWGYQYISLQSTNDPGLACTVRGLSQLGIGITAERVYVNIEPDEKKVR